MRITITVEESGQVSMSSIETGREGIIESEGRSSDEPLDGGQARLSDEPPPSADQGGRVMATGSPEDAGAAPAFDLNGRGVEAP